MILTVTLNPCIDHALFVEHLNVNGSNRVVRVERDVGGKGINLSRVVAELGGSTLATGFLGGSIAASIRTALDTQRVVHRFVPVEGETRVNFSVEDTSGMPPTTFNEKGPQISTRELATLWDLLPELLLGARWMAIGGSIPPGIGPSIYAELTAYAREQGVRCLVDADGEAMRLALGAGPDLVKPNVEEANRLLGKDITSTEDALAGVRELLGQLQGRAPDPIAIISRGGDGAVLACGDGVFVGHTPQVEVKSTIGSGDSLLAGLIWGLEEGLSVEEAFRLGIACGAATATTSGAEIARRPVIEQLKPMVWIDRV